jgi:signal transduction histidine kinase
MAERMSAYGGRIQVPDEPVAGAAPPLAAAAATDGEHPVPAGQPAAPDTSAPGWTMPGATDGPVPPVTLEELRSIDLFDDLDDGQLGEFLAVAKVRHAAAGERLAEADGVPIGVQLLLRGTAQAFLVDGERTEAVGRQRAPTWMGAIAVLSDAPPGVRMVADTDCRIALIPGEKFLKLAFRHPEVHRRVMQQVMPVVARMTQREQDRERLASLGTMAAGLAHELNNPAAAAQSTSAQLAEVLDTITRAFARFVEAGVEREQAAGLVALHREAAELVTGRTALDGLDAADAEEALQDLLEDLGVGEAWTLAEELATAGVDEAWVRRVAELAGPATDAALQWVAASLSARGLVAELQESTRRMSSLVGSVKSYAYLDRGDLVEADLHEGLETTLAVLAHKLKGKGIAIVRDYDRTLPELTIHGSEMNQVWTNLLHNAIQAIVAAHAQAKAQGTTGLQAAFEAAAAAAQAGGTIGTITIRTRREESCAVVEIEDDGPGIPPAVRDRIFDAFFTTKEVGEGTGLGLATVRRIVADRHGGSLSVRSSVEPPTGTTFTVRLSLPHGD